MNQVRKNIIINDILGFLSQHPGALVSTIAEDLQMSVHDVEQQLNQLMADGKVYCIDEHGLTHFFLEKKPNRSRTARMEDTRQTVYQCILQHPGMHQAEIARTLGMSSQLVEYYLHTLEISKDVTSVRDEGGYYLRYYVADQRIDRQEKTLLKLLRHPIPLRIVIALLKHESLKHNEIAEHLSIAPSKLSYHLKKLLEGGVVEVHSYGRDRGYVLIDKNSIASLIKKYNVKLQKDVAIEQFKGVWDDLHYKS